MKKLTVVCSTLFFSVFLLSQAAYPWGWAVHTYIDDQFATKWQIRNENQIYGGLAPDLFNFRFDAPAYREYLFYQTHNNFMKVWDLAQSTPGKALAFGFVSHNEAWGVDSTAHRAGITFGQKGTIPGHPDEGGYVIAKAYLLKGILEQIPQFNALQLPEPVALTVAHELVERGVDILMKNIDPMIGAKMAAAALPPNPNFPLIMEKAYADDLALRFGISHTDAVQFIASSERQFRQTMVLYGQALMQDDATTVVLMSEQLETMAKSFLAAYGLPPLPEGVDIKPLLQFGIGQSIVLCASDFPAEVSATLEFVEQELGEHGISY
jgi:hypothetical protein